MSEPSATTIYEAPDATANAAQAATDYQAGTEDLLGEKMVLNMGPSHPATHRVLRLILELDGEVGLPEPNPTEVSFTAVTKRSRRTCTTTSLSPTRTGWTTSRPSPTTWPMHVQWRN